MPDLLVAWRGDAERGHPLVFVKSCPRLALGGVHNERKLNYLAGFDEALRYWCHLAFEEDVSAQYVLLEKCLMCFGGVVCTQRLLPEPFFRNDFEVNVAERKEAEDETLGKAGRRDILWPRWPFSCPVSGTLGKPLNKENILSPVTCSVAWGEQSCSADWGQECMSKDGHRKPCFISWHHVLAQIY